MSTKTISLSEDAYERLKAEKREGESFSDVVRRLTTGAELSAYHGVLSEETAEKLEASVAEARAERAERRSSRRDRFEERLDDS